MGSDDNRVKRLEHLVDEVFFPQYWREVNALVYKYVHEDTETQPALRAVDMPLSGTSTILAEIPVKVTLTPHDNPAVNSSADTAPYLQNEDKYDTLNLKGVRRDSEPRLSGLLTKRSNSRVK